jgi:hypothetical protein
MRAKWSLTSRMRALSRCFVEDLHHRQISADPGRREHADLLDCARSRSPGTRGSRRHQCKGGVAALPHAYAAGRLGFVALGAKVFGGSPADFGKLIADETEKWGKLIRAAHIKAE